MASEWRGPWKCEKCGKVLGRDSHSAGVCSGTYIPYDRRAPDPLIEEARWLMTNVGWFPEEWHTRRDAWLKAVEERGDKT